MQNTLHSSGKTRAWRPAHNPSNGRKQKRESPCPLRNRAARCSTERCGGDSELAKDYLAKAKTCLKAALGVLGQKLCYLVSAKMYAAS
jgi:hypothetical protein